MAYGIVNNKTIDDDTLLCPMIDARRMEVYDTLYNNKLEEIKPVSADIIDESSFGEYLKEKKILFFGNGAEKCKAVLHHPNALFLDSIHPLAEDMTGWQKKLTETNRLSTLHISNLSI